MSNQLIQLKEASFIKLTGFYESDIWDFTKHPYFPNPTENQKEILGRRNILDFTICKNFYIKQEIKHYCQHIIENKKNKLSYFVTIMGGLIHLMNFVNIFHENSKSILDMAYEISVEGFSQYLIERGCKTHITTRPIAADMEKKEYRHPTSYLRTIMGLYNLIQTEIEIDQNKNRSVFDLDKWDIRELPFKIKGFDPSRPRYTVSFERITQLPIKKITKKHIKSRLQSNKYSTCMDDLKAINLLSKFLSEEYPDVQSLQELDREIMEDYLGYISLNSNLKPRTKSSRIGGLKTFFETCLLYGWDESPVQTLLLSDDVKKKHKVLPRFYEDDVLRQINENLEHLPVQIARMVFVLQNVGMRISELCNLNVDCLKLDSEKDHVLEYFQLKTGEINRVPVNKDAALTIREAIRFSKELYGEEIKYVFLQNKEKPISKDTFSYHVNRLSEKVGIRVSSGELVRIKAHHFRGTLATKYANMGMSMNLIRTLLGQKSLGAIKHYVEILEETITESMDGILQFQDQMIQNIGKEEAVVRITEEDRVEIPLPNGSCAKPLSSGKCTHANACYTCAMFKPDPNNVDLFKYQLSEAKTNVEMAKINGFERVLQVNEDLVQALEKIIISVEKCGA